MGLMCMSENELDLRCYFVTGTAEPAEIVERALAAARGGVGVIQVRSKPISARSLYALTEAVARVIADARLPTKVLVDDRVDVAAALRAHDVPVHGVHVGQDDVPVRAVRQLLGPQAIIGLTTGTLELIHAANEVADVIDYVGCGPFRDTPTKRSGRPPLGLAGYTPIVSASRLPVVAIGDVTKADAPALSSTGVSGLAVVRGLMHAEDTQAYARKMIAGFERGVAR